MSSIGVSFARSLRRATDNGKGALDAAVVGIVTEIGGALIEASPVGNPALWQRGTAPRGYLPGHFRANWQHGAGAKPLGEVPVVDADGLMTLAKIAASVAANPRGKHYLVNNTPYARAIEYGHSTQAPSGVVGITALRFPNLVAQGVLARTRNLR